MLDVYRDMWRFNLIWGHVGTQGDMTVPSERALSLWGYIVGPLMVRQAHEVYSGWCLLDLDEARDR